ncbi:MAG: OsmC-like protein [Candidatus Dadabacteria bacterium CSP1-2]|nr:MAG: OsmC-like protein [Candidatus Dadabacteria bacterium CSP1-2]MBF8302385.1 OsmC-like protein [Candidatus Dadabacteria bacterium]
MSVETLKTFENESDSKALAEKLKQIVEKLQKVSQEPAIREFRADTELVKGYLTKAQIRQFTLDIDEKPGLGGTDKGPNPLEVVLAALGTCHEIVYAMYAAGLGIPLDSIKINVKGRIDARGFFNVAQVPSGFLEVDYEVDIRSPTDRSKIKELVDVVNTHCPLLDTLQRPINVNGSVRLNDELL